MSDQCSITVPDTIEEGIIISWMRQAGDWVDAGEVVAEIETSKAAFDIEAPAAGFLGTPLVVQGGAVTAGQAISVLTPGVAPAGHSRPDAGQAVSSATTAPVPAAPAPAIAAGDWDYEVVVIGAGPGGLECARTLAVGGVKTLLISDEPLPGGECLWRGCIPSKVWRAAADDVRALKAAHRFSNATTRAEQAIDWERLECARRTLLQTRGELAANTARQAGIEFLHGHARFSGLHDLEVVEAGTGRAETRHLSFGAAVIAVGAESIVPPIDGAAAARASGHLVTSEEVWSLATPPQRLLIVGGGAIGTEMAQIFHDFGSSVTLVEAQDRLLPGLDEELAARYTKALETDGVAVHCGASVDSLVVTGSGVRVDWSVAAGARTGIDVDQVLVATGKRPRLDALNLEAVGVAFDRAGIAVDARGGTSQPHICAIGDAVGGLLLAHTAEFQGRSAAQSLLGLSRSYSPELDCGVIFTRPQVAFAGLTAGQARAAGLEVMEIGLPFTHDAYSVIHDDTQGYLKLVAETSSGCIVGVHLLARHADALIGEGVAVVNARMRLEDVAGAIHPHPTQTEVFREAAARLQVRRARRQPDRAPASPPVSRTPRQTVPSDDQRMDEVPEPPEDATVAAVFREIQASYGFIPRLYKVLAHYPPLLRVNWDKVKSVMGSGGLRQELKEAMAVAVSEANYCEYCVGIHGGMLRRLGVTRDQVEATTHMQLERISFLDEKEKALLDFIHRVNLDARSVNNTDMNTLRQLGVTNEQVIQALGVMEVYISWNKMLVALRVELERSPEQGHGDYPDQ